MLLQCREVKALQERLLSAMLGLQSLRGERMDLGGWLRSLGLERYETTFRENDIDETVLPGLTAEDLKELGVASLGHRRKLLDAVAALRADASGKGPEAPPTEKTGSAEDRAERRQVTVMFSDLVGSKALSGRMDPEDLCEVISEEVRGGYTYDSRQRYLGIITDSAGRVAQFPDVGLMAGGGLDVCYRGQSRHAGRRNYERGSARRKGARPDLPRFPATLFAHQTDARP
jgi:hypothetical protein